MSIPSGGELSHIFINSQGSMLSSGSSRVQVSAVVVVYQNIIMLAASPVASVHVCFAPCPYPPPPPPTPPPPPPPHPHLSLSHLFPLH